LHLLFWCQMLHLLLWLQLMLLHICHLLFALESSGPSCASISPTLNLQVDAPLMQQSFCFHYLCNLDQVVTSMLIIQLPPLKMWSSWMNLIRSHTMICYLSIHLKSWRSHMFAQGNFNLNELQSSLGLKVSLLLVGCFIIWDVKLAPQLIGNLVWLFPNGILWWNTLNFFGNKLLQLMRPQVPG
jgi:hypothetical protein